MEPDQGEEMAAMSIGLHVRNLKSLQSLDSTHHFCWDRGLELVDEEEDALSPM